MENLKHQFYQIINLCHNDKFDKKACCNILDNMVMVKPDFTKDKMRLSLDALFNEDNNQLANHKDNELVQLKFGERYIYYNLSQYIHDTGIGHMIDFRIEKNHFSIKISLKPYIRKKNESNEEYKIRREKFFAEFPCSLDKKENIKDTKTNKKYIISSLKQICDAFHIRFVSIDDTLREISFYAKYINVNVKQTKHINTFNKAKIEEIEKECKDAISAISLRHEYDADIEHTINSIIISAHHQICDIVGHKTEFSEYYDSTALANKSKNNQIHNDSVEFGKTISSQTILKIATKTIKAVEKILAETFCLSTTELFWDNGIHFTATFSPSTCDCILDCETPITEKDFIFDKYLLSAKTYDDYNVDVKYIADIKTILENTYHIERLSIKSEYYNSTFRIHSITGTIYDVLYLSDIIPKENNQ